MWRITAHPSYARDCGATSAEARLNSAPERHAPHRVSRCSDHECALHTALPPELFFVVITPFSLVVLVLLDECVPGRLFRRTGLGWRARAGPSFEARTKHFGKILLRIVWLDGK